MRLPSSILDAIPIFNRGCAVLGLMLALLFAAGHVAHDLDYIRNDHLLDDDTRQHLTPFVAARNPEAFHDRFLLDYTAAYLPSGYRWIMHAWSSVTDPLIASKHLGLALMIATAFLAMIVGGTLGGLAGAAVALALLLRSEVFSYHVYAGLYRSFAVPLMLIQLYSLFNRRYTLAGVNLVLQALLYPPICLINLPASGLVFLFTQRFDIRWFWKRGIGFSIGAAASIAVLALFNAKGQDYGQPVRLAEAELMCEWYKLGRLHELPLPPLSDTFTKAAATSTHPGNNGVSWMPALLDAPFWREQGIPVAFVILALIAATAHRSAAGILAALVISGSLLHVASRWQAFALGYPARYLYYAIPFALILLWPTAWGGIRKRWPGRWLPRLVVLGCGLVILFAHPWRLPSHKETVVDTSTYDALYRAVAQTDPDALITAWPPQVLDELPLRSEREVLANIENAHPIYLPYYREIRQRLLATIEMAFATNLNRVVELRDRYGVTHLILTHELYKPKFKSPGVYRPVGDTGSIMRRRTAPENMVFCAPPTSWIWYEDARFKVIDLTALPAPEFATHNPAEAPREDAPLAVYPDDLELVEVRIEPEAAVAGQEVVIDYIWRAPLYLMTRPLLVFVHFLDPLGMAFTGDHLLVQSIDRNLIDWRADAPLRLSYRQEVVIPADTAPGEYRVRLGLVNQRTGRRVAPASTPAGDKNGVLLPVRLKITPSAP